MYSNFDIDLLHNLAHYLLFPLNFFCMPLRPLMKAVLILFLLEYSDYFYSPVMCRLIYSQEKPTS